MTFEVFMQIFVLGLMQGGIYALVAIGLTMIYGVMKVVNFSPGEWLTLGMYLSVTAIAYGASLYVAAPFIAAVVFLLGCIAQRLAVQPALKHPQINQLLILIGLSTLLIGSMQLIWGPNNQVARVSWARQALDIGPVAVTYTRLIAFTVALTIALGLWIVLKRSRLGMAIRAASQNPESAMLMGVDVSKANLATFGLGASLAALAGVMIAPIFFVNPTFGIDHFLLPSFVIVVLGTMGNFVGALIGGLIIGVAESLGGYAFGASWRQAVSLAIFVIVLLVLPRGLFKGRVS